MSENAKKGLVISNGHSPRAGSGKARRLVLFVLGGVILVLTLAYIDGGEEPLHPIVHSVSLPSNGGEAQ